MLSSSTGGVCFGTIQNLNGRDVEPTSSLQTSSKELVWLENSVFGAWGCSGCGRKLPDYLVR